MFDHAYSDRIRQTSGEVTLKNVFQEVIHNLFLKQVNSYIAHYPVLRTVHGT